VQDHLDPVPPDRRHTVALSSLLADATASDGAWEAAIEKPRAPAGDDQIAGPGAQIVPAAP
jgi:hypothetical protein